MARTVAWLAAASPFVAAPPPRAAAQPGEPPRILRASWLGEPAAGFGYDGVIPGPPLRLRRGDDLRVRLVNALSDPTAICWHGLRRANALVAPPRRPAIAPGDAAEFSFACPDAGTFWYHATDATQRRRGLYGVVVVEERESVAVDREMVLIIGDPPPGAPTTGVLPRLLVANGVPVVTATVRPNERLRLRLVNAASMVMAVRIDHLRATVMALDGQACEPFVARDGRVFLGPGNRVDLFVDMTLSPSTSQAITAETDSGETAIATLMCDGPAVRATALADPSPLPANPLPARMEFAGALKLDLDLAAAAPELPLRQAFKVRSGRTVMLGLANRTAGVQTVRVDGHAFRLLDRLDDGWKPFWLDTLVVPPGRTHRIAFVADAAGAWLIDAAGQDGQTSLTAWFEIT